MTIELTATGADRSPDPTNKHQQEPTAPQQEPTAPRPAVRLRFHRRAAIVESPSDPAYPHIHLHLTRSSYWRLRHLHRAAPLRWITHPPDHLWRICVWPTRPIYAPRQSLPARRTRPGRLS